MNLRASPWLKMSLGLASKGREGKSILLVWFCSTSEKYWLKVEEDQNSKNAD